MLTGLLQQVVLMKTMEEMQTARKMYAEYEANKSMKCWRTSGSTTRSEGGLDYLQSQLCGEQELVKSQNASEAVMMKKRKFGKWKTKSNPRSAGHELFVSQ